MQLKKLLISDIIKGSESAFDFDLSRKYLRKSDVETLRDGLFYALYGEPSLAHGSVELSFVEKDVYTLKRDFRENTVTLQTEKDTIVGEAAVAARLHELLPMTAEQWKTYSDTTEEELFDQTRDDVNVCLDSLLRKLTVGQAELQEASTRYKNTLENFKKRDDVLRDLAEDYPEDELLKKIAELSAGVSSLQREQTELGEKIAATEKAIASTDQIARLQKEREALDEKGKEVEKIKEKLARSEKLRRQIFAIRESAALVEENDRLEGKLKRQAADLDKALKEIEVGERVIKGKQEKFSQVSATVQALYTALSELIYDNVTDGKSDEKILDAVAKHFAPAAEKVSTLRAEESVLIEKLRETESVIAVYAKNLRDVYASRAFDSLFRRNNARLQKTSEQLAAIGGEGKSKAELLSSYHETEKRKERIFRDYILSGSLLQELEAIDEKLNENIGANRRMQENLTALENAKETLQKYSEKCRAKTEAADALILSLGTRRQYLQETDALEYGEHCPVCGMPVIEKTDVTAATAEIDEKLRQCEADTSSYRAALADYTQKLDEINLRIGALRAKINTGKGYVESLQNSKLKKIATLEKIFEDAGVRNREQLTVLLEQCVNESIAATTAANELEGLTSTSYIAEENISEIVTYVKELAGDNKGSYFSQARNILLSIEQEEGMPTGSVSGEGPVEGDIPEKLRDAIRRKNEIIASLKTLREEIEYLQGRTVTVQEGERPLTYGQFCIYYAGKQYSSVVEEIRKKEEEKQEMFKGISALLLVMKEKKENAERMSSDLKVMENRFRANLEYLEKIQKTEGYDSDLLRDKTLAELESEILSEGDLSVMQQKADEYDRETIALDSRINAFAHENAVSAEDKKALPSQKARLSALSGEIEEKKDELDRLYGELTAGKAMRIKRSSLLTEVEKYKKSYAFLLRLPEDAALIFTAAVNDALSVLAPAYTAECNGARLTLTKVGDRENKIPDDVRAAIDVALDNAYRHIVFGILGGASSFRVVSLKANAVSDEMRERICAFAKTHDILPVFIR